MNGAYEFRLLELTADEFGHVSRLLRSVFPKSRHLTERYLHWKYAENPDGQAIGCNAWLGGELVGHMAALPMRGRLHGALARGLFFADGAVDPRHRGRKLQSRISAAMFEEALRQGYDFCFGTGNRYSTGPLLTRFSLVGPLDARIGIGLPRRREPVEAPDFERVWSEEAIQWRLRNPEVSYGVAGRLGNLTVTAPAAPGIGAILYHGPDQWHVGAAAAREGPLRLWLGLDPALHWPRSTFVKIPMRLRPSPLNLVFKDLSGAHAAPDPVRTVFRALDFDPY
jgi:GNAT superfamily N-acetyltransferase